MATNPTEAVCEETLTISDAHFPEDKTSRRTVDFHVCVLYESVSIKVSFLIVLCVYSVCMALNTRRVRRSPDDTR